MGVLNAAAREVLTSDALAHLVTIGERGGPQVTCIWVGLEGDEIVSAHLNSSQRKLTNVSRDPRVALSLETGNVNERGLVEYLVVHGEAAIIDGGAPELLQRLAQVYIGPGAVFPPMDDPPAGCVMRIRPTRVGGVGPWNEL